MRQEYLDNIVTRGDKLVSALLQAGLDQQAKATVQLLERASRLKAEEETLRSLPLVEALWWFIENVDEDHLKRTEFFFILRERVQKGE